MLKRIRAFYQDRYHRAHMDEATSRPPFEEYSSVKRFETEHGLSGLHYDYRYPHTITAEDLGMQGKGSAHAGFFHLFMLSRGSSLKAPTERGLKRWLLKEMCKEVDTDILPRLQTLFDKFAGANPVLRDLQFDHDSAPQIYHVLMGIDDAFLPRDIQYFIDKRYGDPTKLRYVENNRERHQSLCDSIGFEASPETLLEIQNQPAAKREEAGEEPPGLQERSALDYLRDRESGALPPPPGRDRGEGT